MAWQRDRTSFPLATVPLLFGVQQFCEGMVWVGLGQGNAGLTQSAACAFLFFAQAFWLFWIPFSAACLELRKKFKVLLGLGAVLGLAGGLTFYLPILLNPAALMVTVVQHSIRYDIAASPALDVIPQLVWHVCYLAVVSWPLLLVAQVRKGLLAFSTALVLSAAISHAYFWYVFASVWCFFAAILSLLLGYSFYQLPMLSRANFASLLVKPVPSPSIRG